MKITFELPDRVWGRLVSVAEDRGTTAAALVSASVTELVKDRRTTVEALVHAGLCDADIGARLGMTTTSVASMRRRLGLQANRRFR